MALILYTGQACCLCEQAEDLLVQFAPQAMADLKKIEVSSDSGIYHLYGARIPVLYREDTKQELAWPFDSVQLVEFIS